MGPSWVFLRSIPGGARVGRKCSTIWDSHIERFDSYSVYIKRCAVPKATNYAQNRKSTKQKIEITKTSLSFSMQPTGNTLKCQKPHSCKSAWAQTCEVLQVVAFHLHYISCPLLSARQSGRRWMVCSLVSSWSTQQTYSFPLHLYIFMNFSDSLYSLWCHRLCASGVVVLWYSPIP